MTSPEPPARPLEDAARASGALLDLWLRDTGGGRTDEDALRLATERLVDFVRRHPADLEFTLLERLDELIQVPEPAREGDFMGGTTVRPPLIVWLLGCGAARPTPPPADSPAARLREAMSAPALMAIMARLRRDHLDALHRLLRGLVHTAAEVVRRAGTRVLDELDDDAISPAWRMLVRAAARRDPSLLTAVLPCDEVHAWPEADIEAAVRHHFGGAPGSGGPLELEDPALSLVHRDEPMASVIAHDAAVLHDLGVRPSALAARLRRALDEATAAPGPWRLELEPLPRGQQVDDPLHDDDASVVHGLGRQQFALSHPEHGTIRGCDLAPLLIERACFFGATRAPLRVDPALAARILGLHPSDRRAASR